MTTFPRRRFLTISLGTAAGLVAVPVSAKPRKPTPRRRRPRSRRCTRQPTYARRPPFTRKAEPCGIHTGRGHDRLRA